jgi:hypothetical protein
VLRICLGTYQLQYDIIKYQLKEVNIWLQSEILNLLKY